MDLGRGLWMREFRLPDAYLPAGFVRQPSNKHWVVKPVDPSDVEPAYTHQYAIQPHAYVSNKRLSPNPGHEDCPMGFGPGYKPFAPRKVGGVDGFWSQVFQSESRNQFNFIFKIGSCVVGLYVDAGEASMIKGNTRFPKPTEGEILSVVGQFVAAYERYITDQGWLNVRGPAGSAAGAPDGAPGGGLGDGAGESGVPGDGSWMGGAAGVALTSMGTVAAAAVTALGAGLMMLGMGVGPRDVIDGAREWFGGGGQAAEVGDEMLPRQLAVAERIRREGWADVSSQEQDLLRASPKWLREAVQSGLPAQTVDQYRWGTLSGEYLTCGGKVIQSGCDVAIGVLSTANPAFGIHYTYWKNVLGSISEGAADHRWGKNEKGLLRNVGEGLIRGTARAGVEIAVDAATGHLMAGGAGRFEVDPNTISAGAFAAKEAAGEVAGAYFAGQGGKYAVDVASGGYLGTTSPVEKATLDAVTGTMSDLAGSGGRGGAVPAAPRLPHMAQNLVQ